MRLMPVRAGLVAAAGQWEDSRYLDGCPGQFVVIARRAGSRWYVAGINGMQEAKRLDLDLSFIPTERGVLIRDGAQLRELVRQETGAGRQKLTLPAAAGFVMIFEP
jgi:hypothetical protein